MNKKSSPGQTSKNSRLRTNIFLEDPSIENQDDDAIVELGTLENELD